MLNPDDVIYMVDCLGDIESSTIKDACEKYAREVNTSDGIKDQVFLDGLSVGVYAAQGRVASMTDPFSDELTARRYLYSLQMDDVSAAVVWFYSLAEAEGFSADLRGG
jgi:hypothetical protein